ncbi:GDT1-like protein 5 [Hibiscus syriacus]|uniref:GDT1 family protein n=1 Tax=Hibiscus syriacus TaxID=106335 RepID=A0A6A2X9X0_HIBSY|nr:GDT1-like protein 5 [Hibiscus syriacus]
MRHPRGLVLSGCMASLIAMTILSAAVGWAAPNLDMDASHNDSAVFRIRSLVYMGWIYGRWVMLRKRISELAEVEAKLDADSKVDSKKVKEGSKDGDELKKKRRPFLTQFFSPIFLKAFSITFFGEWGDRSQLATIGMAADEDPFGVVLGGILGQALCTVVAVVGGKSLASRISEKIVALAGGVLFIIFGIQSFLSSVQS